jgi:hypothetical protein
MKTIKAIKESKYSKEGDLKRVTDKDADVKVQSGYWMYVPKKEWKDYNKSLMEEKKSNEKTETLKNTHKNKKLDRKTKNLQKN